LIFVLTHMVTPNDRILAE